MKTEEQSYGALTHLVNILPLWGILINIVIWINFRERSRFIVFHARQAIVFQVIYLAPVLIVMMLAGVFSRLCALLLPVIGNLFHFVNVVVLLLALAVYMGYCIIGFIVVRLGGDFQYILAGKLVKSFLSELD